MGRFATLNADTQDLVNCLLPALATSFKIDDPVNIIPEDIRMRAWDCERRDHIKDQTENDPRNWGVQFLKDLMSISRLRNGDLAQFHVDLRAKVAKHEPKHPWCRLADIKEIKEDYENPGRRDEVNAAARLSSSDSSTDSYFEELVEPEDHRGGKRGRKGRNHEIYEARVQHKRRKFSHGRLRRTEGGGFQRKDKPSKHRYSAEHTDHSSAYHSVRRPSRTITSDGEETTTGMSLQLRPTPGFSHSPAPHGVRSYTVDSINMTNEPLAVQKLQAELEVAEAELKAARLKYAYIEAKEQAESQVKVNGKGVANDFHVVD